MKITKILKEARLSQEKVIGHKLLLVNSGIISESLKDPSRFLREFKEDVELLKTIFMCEELSRRDQEDQKKIFKSALAIAEVSPEPLMNFVASMDMSTAKKFWTTTSKKAMVSDLETQTFEKDFLRTTAQLTKFIELAKDIADVLDNPEHGVQKKSFWNKISGGSSAMEKEIMSLVQASRLPISAKLTADAFSQMDLESRKEFSTIAKSMEGLSVVKDIGSKYSELKAPSWMDTIKGGVSRFGDKLGSALDKVLPGGSHRPQGSLAAGLEL